jgi:hypothetical protein
MSKIIDVTKRLRRRARFPGLGSVHRPADPKMMLTVTAAFAVGVLVVAWLSSSLRLEADGARFGWVVLVAFGMAWHGDLANAWRVAAGLIGGAVAGLAGYYGALSILPVKPAGLALGLAITAAGVGIIAHLLPRMFSFAAAVVGFGVGIAAAGQFPLRPTTPVDDLFSLALIISTAFAIGSFGSMALRGLVTRVAGLRPGALARLIPHRTHDSKTAEIPAVRPTRRSPSRRAAGAAR